MSMRLRWASDSFFNLSRSAFVAARVASSCCDRAVISDRLVATSVRAASSMASALFRSAAVRASAALAAARSAADAGSAAESRALTSPSFRCTSSTLASASRVRFAASASAFRAASIARSLSIMVLATACSAAPSLLSRRRSSDLPPCASASWARVEASACRSAALARCNSANSACCARKDFDKMSRSSLSADNSPLSTVTAFDKRTSTPLASISKRPARALSTGTPRPSFNRWAKLILAATYPCATARSYQDAAAEKSRSRPKPFSKISPT